MKSSFRIGLLAFAGLLLSSVGTYDFALAQVYRDSTASVEERVEDLLGRMTLDEKIGQMTQADRGALSSENDITTYGLGSILSGGGSAPSVNTPSSWADMVDRFQAKALGTRLAIPLIYGIDAVHGHNNVKGAVIFPHNIGMGCTRDTVLARHAAEITAAEVAGTGIRWTFAPCIAVPQNERWGRTYEGFSENTELTVQMARAVVLGFQGDTLGKAGTSILACPKHYLGDGGTTDGHDQGNTVAGEATIRRIHLPGYISALEAGAGSVMASYNSINGQKMHGSSYWMTTVLKGELGFQGFIVSDWSGIDQLPGNYTSDVETSINAGIDMVMVPNTYTNFISTLKSLANQGRISQERIDDAVRRILRIKFTLGIFEHPFADRILTGRIGNADHRDVARQCVRESLVLLAKKDGILPVPKQVVRIHVAGRAADNIGYQCGGWTISWQGSSGEITTGTTILEAVRLAVPQVEVTYSQDGLGAEGADFGIVAVGESPYAESAGDRDDLNLSDESATAVRNMKEAGIPVVAILISGRPMILDRILHWTDALFAAWLPGTEGNGITDVLFGDVLPQGRLSHSWPRSMEQIPVNFGDYLYDPLFEYGYGITSFDDPAAGSPPEVYSAAVDTTGLGIEVSFNKAMEDPSSEPGSSWSVVRSGLDVPVTGAHLKTSDSTTIVLQLTTAVRKGDTLTLAYTEGNIRARDSGKLAGFGPISVFNLVDEAVVIPVLPGKVEAEDYSNMHGVQTEATSDVGGGLNVGYIETGDWMDYYVDVSTPGSYIVRYRVACLSASGQIRLKTLSGTTLALTDLPVTGGWQTWTTMSDTADLVQGNQILRVYAARGGFNLNWIQFDLLTGMESGSAFGSTPVLALEPNRPNPFNDRTILAFSLDRDGPLRLEIFNLRGERVEVLARGSFNAGRHEITFQTRDMASGLYIARLEAQGQYRTQKMALIR